MPSNQDLFNCAARLSEEGRLLWILGRSLARAMDDPDGLGPWAIKTYRELQALEIKPGPTPPVSPQRPPTRMPAIVDAGSPVVAWIASCSRHQVWTSIAVGADIEGHKQILAVEAGSTSDPLVCRRLVEALGGESLRLLVTDGSLTLDDTIKLHWDEPPKVAHCRSDVRRSVLAHLQGDKRRSVAEQIQRAWDQSWPQSQEELNALVNDLRKDHPGAADRLERSLAATLLVDRFGVIWPLREHLLVAGVSRMAFAGAVKWGGAKQATLKTGLTTWLQRTLRLPGYRALPDLVESIDRAKFQEKEQVASQSVTGKDATYHNG